MGQQPDRNDSPGERAGLPDLARELLRTDGIRINTQIPARVISFDPSAPVPSAVVQIDMRRIRLGGPGLGEIDEGYPPTLVPVEFPRGGGYRIAWTLAPGDTGWLEFSQRSIDRWKTEGGGLDPQIARTHSLADGVFRPGIHSQADPAAAVAPGFTIGKEDGTQTISLPIAGGIKLAAAGGVTLNTGIDLATFLGTLQAAINGWVVVPNDGGAALKVALAAWLASAAPT